MLRNGKSGQKYGEVLRLRDAALRLGVSFTTIKQWIYKKKSRSLQTARGHHRIPQSEIDRFLFRTRGRTEMDREQAVRRVSGRNQLVGRRGPRQRSDGRGDDLDWRPANHLHYYGTLGLGNVAQARADCCSSGESYRSDDSASVR